jgi:hypothetical protein
MRSLGFERVVGTKLLSPIVLEPDNMYQVEILPLLRRYGKDKHYLT